MRIPRSPHGNTSGRPRENIRNICAVHTPIPRTSTSRSITSASSYRCRLARHGSFRSARSVRSRMARSFCGEMPNCRSSGSLTPASTAGTIRCGATCASSRSLIDRAAFEEICCDTIDQTSISKRFRCGFKVQGPTRSITSLKIGSTRRRCRVPAAMCALFHAMPLSGKGNPRVPRPNARPTRGGFSPLTPAPSSDYPLPPTSRTRAGRWKESQCQPWPRPIHGRQ